MKNRVQKGFTIVELLIATAVFSVVLLMAAAGILEITRMYFRGVVQARTQETARTIIDELAETIRYGTEDVSALSFIGAGDIPDGSFHEGNFCVGSKRYSYAIDRQLNSSGSDEANKQKRHVLWVDNPSTACSPGTVAALNDDNPSGSELGRELLSENMRLTHLEIDTVGETSTISIGVAYGDTSVLDYTGPEVSPETPVVCKTGANRSVFCATSDLSVTVTKRL